MTLSEIARGRQNTTTTADSSASIGGGTVSYGAPPTGPVTTTTAPAITATMEHSQPTVTSTRDSMFNRTSIQQSTTTYDHSAMSSNVVSMAP